MRMMRAAADANSHTPAVSSASGTSQNRQQRGHRKLVDRSEDDYLQVFMPLRFPHFEELHLQTLKVPRLDKAFDCVKLVASAGPQTTLDADSKVSRGQCWHTEDEEISRLTVEIVENCENGIAVEIVSSDVFAVVRSLEAAAASQSHLEKHGFLGSPTLGGKRLLIMPFTEE